MRTLLQITFFLLSTSLLAQTQTVKGTIVDLDAQTPLPGVNVILIDSDPFIGAVTDIDGNFRIENVPVGRQNFLIKYIGYKTQTIPNVLVTAGKQVVLNVQIEESVEALNEVVITADSEKDRPNNEMAKVSARTFSLEEVTRFSGGRNDVARLATNFAGVSGANDSRNDIVVRGNSPTGLLWRVEGLPIATTNHFSTLGTTGGPVSALNTNLLRTSDFLTGAFPAEYGNANAAVFDVKFRNGNSDELEFTGQVSAFSGAEGMIEGPMKFNKGASFLVSYRYGIASVAATGTSAIPFYQDLSFKLNFGDTKLGRFELFGMGGLSSIDFIGDELDEDDLFADPSVDSYVESRVGLVGINNTLLFKNKSYLKSTVGATLVGTNFEQDNYTDDDRDVKYLATEADDTEVRYTVSTQYNRKFNSRFNLRVGGMVEIFNLDNMVRDRDRRVDIPDENGDGIPDFFITIRDDNGSTPLSQLYAQAEYKFSDELSWNFGLHSQFLEYTGDAMVGPRTALSWQFKPKHRLSLAYGLHGQMQPLPILLLQEQVGEDEFERTNDELEFTKSHHVVLGYDFKPSASWRIKAEAYVQSIFDAPVEAFSSSYSVLNEGADFVFDERSSLVNEGTGMNYGLELTVEKFFSEGYYGLATISLFDSQYEGSDGIERSTAFNNQYVTNVLFGKEWPVGKDKRNVLTFDTKVTYSGGRPYTPIDLEATRANDGREVLQEELAFSETYSDYFRWDVKFGFRLNGKESKVSHQFFVDLQNVTNRENIFVERYNPVTDEINEVNQIGFFPDVMYRIQF
ncbi:MAG: TonB-dependent receptor [Bacteroidota bacterium]